MPPFASDQQSWILVAVSIGAALALPAAAWRRLTPDVLREHHVLYGPGRVVATMALLLVVHGIAGAVLALAAIHHPFVWATAALILSGIAVILIYLVRYRAAARAFAREVLGRPDGARGHPDA